VKGTDAVFERRCLLGAAVLLLLAAWFSLGFHHNDEHFQLLEFANFKAGLTPEADLPWEFRAKIRCWFQPAIAFLALEGFGRLGVTNPFLVAVFLRLLSAILYGFALVRLIHCSRHWFQSPEIRRVAIAGACLLWFVPYLAVRFSGEGWSGSLFFLGFASLALLAQGERVSTLELGGAGLAMGLAFAARFQSGILIAPALVWFLWAARPKPSSLLAVGLGLLAGIGASLVVDRWGYGEWVFTPWRYLNVQLLQGTAANRFGTSPWWWYFPKIVLSAGPPIGLALLVGAVVTWVRKPASALAWASLPFFLAHCLLSHKELRFLFPLAPIASFVALAGVESYPWTRSWLWSVPRARPWWILLAGLNAAGFAIRTLVPAREQIGVQHAIYENTPRRLLIVAGKDPYVLGGLHSHFYRDPDLRIANLTDVGGATVAAEAREPSLVAFPPFVPVDTSSLSCRVLYRTLPEWAQREPVRSWLRWAEPGPWALARCVQRVARP
jgi:phosphatidylinositol glycan class B